MTKLRATQLIGLGFCGAMLVAKAAMAQMPFRATIIAYLKELH
jgi:hypothetical protein